MKLSPKVPSLETRLRKSKKMSKRRKRAKVRVSRSLVSIATLQIHKKRIMEYDKLSSPDYSGIDMTSRPIAKGNSPDYDPVLETQVHQKL